MKVLKKCFIATATLFLALSLVITGCQKQEETSKSAEKPAKTAKLVYVNWSEGVAYTHLAKVVLEDQMGYEVKLTAADVAPGYTAIAQGDMDAFMETWLPVLHKDYVEKYQKDIIDLGAVYEGTQSGLVVPAYMEIDKISQLDSIKDELGGKITGIDAGAGVMKTTEQVIEKYNLDIKLMSSSGPAMTAALKNAVDKKRPIVVTGWRPHWMFGKWDLKFLEQDPDKQVWSKGTIHIMGRKDLRADKPELAQFLSNMFLTDPDLSSLMLAIADSDADIETAARNWMKDNMDIVKKWVPGK
jgi:glycine betaine/proline transport system substrate-binding protein